MTTMYYWRFYPSVGEWGFMCWSIILVLSKLTEIVEITPRDWIMPELPFPLGKRFGGSGEEQNLKTTSE